MSGSPDAVRWRLSPATTRPLRLLAYAAVGLTVGPVVGFVCLLLATLVVDGGVGVAALVVAVALLATLGVGSGRALLALGAAPPGVREDVRALSRRWLLASGAGGAALGLWGLLRTDAGVAVLGGCLGAGVAALVVGSGLRSEGSVDPRARTVDYAGRSLPLDAVREVRSVRIGPVVLCLFRYHAGRVGPATPRYVVLSPAALDAVESVRAADDAPADPRADDDGRTRPAAVRWVAAAFGVGCVAVGGALWVVPLGDDAFVTPLRLFGLSFGLLFGAVFLRYAAVA